MPQRNPGQLTVGEEALRTAWKAPDAKEAVENVIHIFQQHVPSEYWNRFADYAGWEADEKSFSEWFRTALERVPDDPTVRSLALRLAERDTFQIEGNYARSEAARVIDLGEDPYLRIPRSLLWESGFLSRAYHLIHEEMESKPEAPTRFFYDILTAYLFGLVKRTVNALPRDLLLGRSIERGVYFWLGDGVHLLVVVSRADCEPQ